MNRYKAENAIKITPELFDDLENLATAYIDEYGKEINNPKPLFIDTGLRKRCLNDEIQRILRTELSIQAYNQGQETFDEFNDFDIDDDFESLEQRSNYELVTEEIPESYTEENVAEIEQDGTNIDGETTNNEAAVEQPVE